MKCNYQYRAIVLLYGLLICGMFGFEVYGEGISDIPQEHENTQTEEYSDEVYMQDTTDTIPSIGIDTEKKKVHSQEGEVYVVEITKDFDIEVLYNMPEIVVRFESGVSTRFVQIVCNAECDHTHVLARIKMLEGVIRVYRDIMRNPLGEKSNKR